MTLPPCKRGLRATEISKLHLYASERQSPKTWIIGDNQPGWGNVCALFDWNDLPSWRQFVSIFVINVKSPPHALPPRPPSRLHKEQKIDAPIVTNKGWSACILVCYTAVFSVVTQCSFPQSGEERCVTTLKTAVWQTTCICKQTSVIVKNTLEYEDMETEMKDIPEVLKKNG